MSSVDDGSGIESDTPAGGGPVAFLRRFRTDPRYHWGGVVGAVVVGLAVASLHWVGLVVGGALVALVTTSPKRGVLAGLGFGVLVVVVWTLRFVVGGVLGEVIAMGQISAIAVAMAVGLSLLGSLVRSVV